MLEFGSYVAGTIIGVMVGFILGFDKGKDRWQQAFAKGFRMNVKSKEVLEAMLKHPLIGIKGDTIVDPVKGITVNLEGVRSVTDDLEGAQVTTGKDGSITIRREEEGKP